jgi:LytR cell envelope-related transcriptional attenuator
VTVGSGLPPNDGLAALRFRVSMRRTWPIIIGIALIGALAGVAIAGQPTTVDTFVIAPASVGITSPSASSESTSSTELVTTTTAASSTESTTAQSATTTTMAPTGTVSPTTTEVVTITINPGVNTTLGRADVRLVIANGAGTFDLAGRNGDRLRAAGYTQIDLEDAAKVPATVLYYRPGFDDEAAIVAADLQVPDAILEPLPETPITIGDALGDIIVVLGPDARR